MIWDYIRDFLVQYIFGGNTSDGRGFYPKLGMVFSQDYDMEMCSVNDVYFSLGDVGYSNGFDNVGKPMYLSMADWLSTTFTIIIMCMIVVFAIWLVRWVYKLVTSAFLLK